MKYWITSLLFWLVLFLIITSLILLQQADEFGVDEIKSLKQNYLMVLGFFGMIVLIVHLFWFFSLKTNK